MQLVSIFPKCFSLFFLSQEIKNVDQAKRFDRRTRKMQTERSSTFQNQPKMFSNSRCDGDCHSAMGKRHFGNRKHTELSHTRVSSTFNLFTKLEKKINMQHIHNAYFQIITERDSSGIRYVKQSTNTDRSVLYAWPQSVQGANSLSFSNQFVVAMMRLYLNCVARIFQIFHTCINRKTMKCKMNIEKAFQLHRYIFRLM